MPMTSPLTLSVAPPPGSGLGGTTVNAGTMAANTAATATLAGTPYQQTSTALSSAPNPSGYGQSVTFTATVSPADGQGTVSFASTTGKQMTALCPGQSLRRIGDSYRASCTTSSLPVGTHTIMAAYSGDTHYGGSSATLSQTVKKAPTVTVISSSKNPSTYGQRVTFTAIVSPADGAGTMTFWQAGHTIPGCASEPLQDNAGTYRATCTTSALPDGTDKIQAVYTGDNDYSGSAGTLSQVVNRIPIRR
jgi:large repetitive protein